MRHRINTASAATALLMALILSAGLAVAGEMKSDPDNHYLDPEEIRPIVKHELEFHLDGWTNPDHSFTPLKEFDLRLIEGQIPLYTIEGDLAAYLYIAYIDRGPLPTIEDIMENTREVLEIDREGDEASIAGKHYDTKQMLLERYPYALKCVYAAVGINDKWPTDTLGAGVPGIIINYPVALDGARDYFGTDDVEFVRYIYCSRLVGYEFSNGVRNIIIPFDLGIVETKKVMTRDEVDGNIDEYAFTPTDRQINGYFEDWSYLMREYEVGGDSLIYDEEKFEVNGYSNNHYLPQREYDFAHWWYDDWDTTNNCPIFSLGGEGQHSMLGKCWAISFASCMAYINNTRAPELLKEYAP